jgi:hypothetical protein
MAFFSSNGDLLEGPKTKNQTPKAVRRQRKVLELSSWSFPASYLVDDDVPFLERAYPSSG